MTCVSICCLFPSKHGDKLRNVCYIKASTHWQNMTGIKTPTAIVFYGSLHTGSDAMSEYDAVQFPVVNMHQHRSSSLIPCTSWIDLTAGL